MNNDTIIRMAREAGISESHAQGMQGFLERFAHLVYEATFRDAHFAASRTILDAAILEEREACAIAGFHACVSPNEAVRVRDAIRARGNT